MADEKTKTKQIDGELLTMPMINDVKELLELGGAVVVGEPIENPDGSLTIFVGKDVKPHQIAALNPKLPDFVRQSETFIEPDSFIAYLTKFKTKTAIVRASLKATQFVAVLDYHGDSRAETDGAVPGRGAHVVTLDCPWDPDYAKWRKLFDMPIEQDSLLEFIEDVIHTIGAPLAGDLIDAISNVEINRESKFKSVRNLRNGTVQFTYAEEERGDAIVVKMPDTISVVTPIFQGAGSLQLDVKLRYHLDKGALFFKLVLPGREKLERDGFRTIGAKVTEKTGTPVFYGA